MRSAGVRSRKNSVEKLRSRHIGLPTFPGRVATSTMTPRVMDCMRPFVVRTSSAIGRSLVRVGDFVEPIQRDNHRSRRNRQREILGEKGRPESAAMVSRCRSATPRPDPVVRLGAAHAGPLSLPTPRGVIGQLDLYRHTVDARNPI